MKLFTIQTEQKLLENLVDYKKQKVIVLKRLRSMIKMLKLYFCTLKYYVNLENIKKIVKILKKGLEIWRRLEKFLFRKSRKIMQTLSKNKSGKPKNYYGWRNKSKTKLSNMKLWFFFKKPSIKTKIFHLTKRKKWFKNSKKFSR